MKKTLPIVIVVVLVVVGVAVYLATRQSGSPTTNSNSSSTSGSNSSPQATNRVTIDNFAFSPAHSTVKKGTTVTWSNQDSAPHTVTENDGKDGPKSDTLSNGQNYSFTYGEAGTFQYHCTLHASMTGTVTVTE